MEHIRQAVELAKARSGTMPKPPAGSRTHHCKIRAVRPGERKEGDRHSGDRTGGVVGLDPELLEAMRVRTQRPGRSRAYDMLRTQCCGPWPRKIGS